jgi:hypothetical protein
MATELVEGKYGLQPLIISKSLRAEYKQVPAHKALADRMKARDPGNAPASGDRIPFVYVQPPTGQAAPDLQGDRIETPTYIKEKGLKPDYMFYIDHQISNPVCQLFGVVVDQIPGFAEYKPRGGWSENLDTRIAQRETAAYHLLFDEAIQRNNMGAKRAFGKMLGASVIKTEEPVRKPTARIASSQKEPPKRQSTLDSMFADRMMIDASKQVEMIKKQKLKEAKEAEEAAAAAQPTQDPPARKKRSAPKKETAV